jgi:hypothetical protein
MQIPHEDDLPLVDENDIPNLDIVDIIIDNNDDNNDDDDDNDDNDDSSDDDDVMPPLELVIDPIEPLVNEPLQLWTREMIVAMFRMNNCRFCEKIFYKCPHCPYILRSIAPHNCQTMWFEMTLRTHFNRHFRGCVFLCEGCRRFDDCQHSLVYIGV